MLNTSQTVFSTPFFQVEAAGDGELDALVVSRQFWIYWALAIPASLLTFASWIFWDVAPGKKLRSLSYAP